MQAKDALTLPSVFEAFNARSLEPHEVARSFTPPRQYGQLARPTHTVIVGPRGSGKTTLLKMLQQPALESWHHPQANYFRTRIDFTGVFIPTDRTWSAQLDSLGALAFEPAQVRLLTLAAFTTHTLRQLIGAVHYRVSASERPDLAPHRRVPFTRAQEVTFVQETAHAWALQPVLPSLLALRRSLTSRLSEIASIVSKEALLGSTGRDERLASVDFLHKPLLQSAAYALDVFQDVAGQGREKWALLFDELELAPKWVRSELLAFLRSVDDRFIFKLSMSPYSEDVEILDTPTAAMPGQDYEPVTLWYAHKEDGFRFCRALLRSLLALHERETVDPVSLFGRSEFETPTSEWMKLGTAYHPGSRLHSRFLRLAQKDRTFRNYLRERNIDPHRLDDLEGTERAADVRKITALVAVREAFRGTDEELTLGGRTRTRSRKNPDLYRGAAALFAMVEGNPRWFIGIIGSLLQRHYAEGEEISAAAQAAEVSKAANRFRALLKTIPCPTPAGGSQRGVLAVLDPIGDYFFRSVVVEDFNPDPPGSFLVDAHVSTELAESLGKALNAGAIVYVPDPDSQVVLGSLRGKRFRMSYLLASHYGIPIRLGRPVSLSHILRFPSAVQADLLNPHD
jgi:hypothetical protein